MLANLSLVQGDYCRRWSLKYIFKRAPSRGTERIPLLATTHIGPRRKLYRGQTCWCVEEPTWQGKTFYPDSAEQKNQAVFGSQQATWCDLGFETRPVGCRGGNHTASWERYKSYVWGRGRRYQQGGSIRCYTSC